MAANRSPHAVTFCGVFALLRLLAATSGREIYVDHAGSDTEHCGASQKTPCKTVGYAVVHSSANDVVEVKQDGPAYVVQAGSGDFIDVTHSLTIRSTGGGPVALTCPDGRAGMFNVFDSNYTGGDGSTLVTLALEHVVIKNCVGTWAKPGVILITNAAVKIRNCQFLNDGTVLHHPHVMGMPCNVVKVSISGTSLRSCGFVKPHVPSVVLMGCDTTQMTVNNTTFDYSSVRLQAKQTVDLIMNLVNFNGVNLRGPSLDVILAKNRSTISLNNAVIANHNNSRESAVVIAVEESINASSLHFNNVTLVNNTFTKATGGAFSLVARSSTIPITTNIWFTGCTFSRNSAQNLAGALFIEGMDNVKVNHCTFEENTATDGGAIMIMGSTHVTLYNSTFAKNQALGLPDKGYHGTGGAIRSLQSDLMLTSCSFADNKAGLHGQSLHATDMSTIYVTESSFFTSIKNEDAAPKTELYIRQSRASDETSPTELVILNGNKYLGNETCSKHGMYHAEMKGMANIDQNEVCCPVGEHIEHLLQPQHPLAGFDVDSTLNTVWCAACPVGTYNLQNECIQVNAFGAGRSQESLCLDCPEYARCAGAGRIRALRNYWGLRNNNTTNDVTFYLCPDGYCDEADCHSIKCCSNKRDGILCGTCQPGHAFSPSNNSCIPQTDCHTAFTITVLWAVAFGLIYLVVIGLFVVMTYVLERPILCGYSACNNAARSSYITLDDDRDIDNGLADKGEPTHVPQASDNFEPSLSSEDGEPNIQAQFPVLDEETQTSERFSQQMLAQAKLNLVRDLPCVLCVFWMMVQLLEDVYQPWYSKGAKHTLIGILMNVINFRPVFHNLPRLCISGDMAIVLSITLTLVSVGTMFLVIIALLIFGNIALKIISKVTGHDVSPHHLGLVLCRTCVVLVVLTYLPLVKTCFQLIHCVCIHPIANMVMFKNGTVACYQWWHWLVVAFMVNNLAPTGLMISMAMPLIKIQYIRHQQFITGLFSPLITSIFWIWRHSGLVCPCLIRGESHLSLMESDLSDLNQHHLLPSKMIYSFFARPLTEQFSNQMAYPWRDKNRNWLILIFVRVFFLACVSVMLSHWPHVRCIVMIGLLSIVVLLHLHWQPYGSKLINCIECNLLGILIILAILNMTSALAYTMGEDPHGYLHNMVYVTDWIFSVTVMIIVALYLVGVFYYIIKGIAEKNM